MRSYIAGTLSADAAEAFERHYFACDPCWRELERSLEIRAALTQPSGTSARTRAIGAAPATRQVPWRWLAAAATVVLATSLWQWSSNPSPSSPSMSAPVATPAGELSAPAPVRPVPPAPSAPPVRRTRPRGNDELALRSPSQSGLLAKATRDPNGDIKMEWPVVQKAAKYVVRIFASDGTLVLTRETTAALVVVEAASLAGRSADERLFATVRAVSALGVELETSPRVELPARREASQS